MKFVIKLIKLILHIKMFLLLGNVRNRNIRYDSFYSMENDCTGRTNMTRKTINYIKDFYGVDVIRDVVRDWGEQHWLQLEPDRTKNQPIVSVATIYPRKGQPYHGHFGYHEIIIGISGQCTHWCNDREIVLTKGKIGHISNDCNHRFVNTTDEPASFISIIYSDITKPLEENEYLEHIDIDIMAKKLNLNQLISNFADLVHMKCFLLYPTGQVYGSQKDLPDLCKYCIEHKQGDCLLHKKTQQPQLGTFQCHFGVAVNQLPVLVKGVPLGYLICGFGRLSDIPDQELLHTMRDEMQAAYDTLPLLSPNHLISIARDLSLLTNDFIDLFLNSQREDELKTYKNDLNREREAQSRLETLLNRTQLKFLESQINVHFLFNTLNTIAQQAYLEGADTVASLTYALSNLLRLSLGKEEAQVTIQEELNYIRDYLYIQNTRFPNKFKAEIHVDPKIMGVRIPLMSLMVLVENAILHGFQNIDYPGKLIISGNIEGDHILLQVEDNGCGISPELSDMVRKLPETDDIKIHLSGIGLKNIYLRLKLFFKGNFTLLLDPLPDKGTLATLTIPKTY